MILEDDYMVLEDDNMVLEDDNMILEDDNMILEDDNIMMWGGSLVTPFTYSPLLLPGSKEGLHIRF